MAVADVRYGGEVRTATGRIRAFDSVECLAMYVASVPDRSAIRDVWVADYASATLIPVTSAIFVRGGRLHSPMGRQLTAFASTHSGSALVSEFGGTVLDWAEVLAQAALPTSPSARSTAFVDSAVPDTPSR